jgi:MFS family permease
MGMVGGTWMVRVPAAKAQAQLSDGTLGAALFAVPIGLVLGAALAERLVDRVGSAWVVRVTGVGNCLLMMTPGLASSLPELMAALLVWGIAGGTLDVGQNAQGVRVEGEYGRPVMTSMHAFFSLGAIIGALAGGGFAWAGVGLLPSLATVGVTGAVIDATASRWLLPGTHHPPAQEPSVIPAVPSGEPIGRGEHGDDADETAPVRDGGPQRQTPHGAVSPRDDPSGAVGHGTGADLALRATAPLGEGHKTGPRRLLERRRVRRAIVALGVLGICAMVGEGAVGDWSAVYLKDNLSTSAGFAALGFAAFSVTMTIGRALGDQLIHWFGVVPLIRGCGAVATAGLALGLSTANPVVAVAGFAIFGVGLSAVVPQVFAAGGRADPAHPGSGVAKVVGFGYAGMSAGPAVIGGLASRIGLHYALAIPVVLALWIAVGASALAPPGRKDVPRTRATGGEKWGRDAKHAIVKYY